VRSKDDSGPAFPRPKFWPTDGEPDLEGHPQGGMSLRDYFAGQALAGNCGYSTSGESVNSRTLAVEAYTIADLMLAERKK
jgi:hypothetical protein